MGWVNEEKWEREGGTCWQQLMDSSVATERFLNLEAKYRPNVNVNINTEDFFP